MPLRVFPVAQGARYENDWGQARTGFKPNGEPRTHEGNDLFGPEGRPLLAVDDGMLSFGNDPFGGQIAVLRANDGTRYYYAHLSRYEGVNRRVRAGDVIGYLGRTGNAITTAPHLHFQMHPGGGEPTNPFPHLRRAEIRRAGQAEGGSLFWPVLIATGLGVGLWAYSSPKEARALLRRVTG